MPLFLKLLSEWGVTGIFQRDDSAVFRISFFFSFLLSFLLSFFFFFSPSSSPLKRWFWSAGFRGTEIVRLIMWIMYSRPTRCYLLQRRSDAQGWFWTVGIFLLPLSSSIDSTSSPGIHRHIAQSIGYAVISPLYRNSPSAWALCSTQGGGIIEMGESISVAGMYFSYSFVCFMYGSFFIVAHATHQVSESVLCHCKRPVCT